MPRLLYTLAVMLLMPWALVHLLWRARRQPEYLQHWGERFGFFAARAKTDAAPTLWIHAVSVGETRAAQPLVAALRQHFPAARIVFTHMTPTARETSAAMFGDSVERVYLPYDMPWAVDRFLRHFRPALGLIMETELWPNLIAACNEQKIPLHLVNARLSARSASRYARFGGLMKEVLQKLTSICAQTADDAARFAAQGARDVVVTGNVKFDSTVPASQLALGVDLRARCHGRAVWLAASTREGEEELILGAWRKAGEANETTTALLVIVPRHPQRFDAVTKRAIELGFTVQRRSAEGPVAPETQVLIGDSMGEMLAYYAMADVAFIGGSLLDYGSQNLIEACAVGTPVLIGPSTRNFAEAVRDATACGAAKAITDADQLVVAVRALLIDEAQLIRMGEAGRRFAEHHRGATQRTLTHVLGVVAR
jgi:3-deoxy-D-manno-octulosonic-acid transferase